MAKAKKRVTTRKKSSKRGKAGAKLGRKMAKHAKPKKAKSKVQRAGMSAKKSAAKKQRQAVETTKIDVIDEAAPGVISVKEYELGSDGDLRCARHRARAWRRRRSCGRVGVNSNQPFGRARLCAASGRAAAAPPSSVMNSRRFTARCLPCFRPKG